MSQSENYGALSSRVSREGDVVIMSMGELRDLHGAGKLGANVVTGIHDKLDGVGLGHSPAELPTAQGEQALIYRKGSGVARLIEAVVTPGQRSVAILKELSGQSSETSETIRKIRELVCG